MGVVVVNGVPYATGCCSILFFFNVLGINLNQAVSQIYMHFGVMFHVSCEAVWCMNQRYLYFEAIILMSIL